MNFKKHLLAALAIIAAVLAVVAIAQLGLSAIKQTSYDAGYSAAEAKQATAVNTALAEQQRTLRAEFTRQLTNANNAVTALRAVNRDIAQRELLLRQEIDYVTTHYRQSPAATPEPLPACIFTHGFVSVYNGAISPGGAASAAMPAADTAAGTDTTASAATAIEADKLQPSNIQQRDILHHIAGYGSRCQAIEAQLNQLLDYLESINNKGAV
ncbi:hypothetical protein [Rheinheimera baltica]|uniref:hypothetical protein n=1 Tax=Rheinheimera baltica TaxID=67576 RepID=UPI00040A63DF|nr:hypothetical protein [Rheinheimera baltica]